MTTIVQQGDDATGSTGVASGAAATCLASNTAVGHGVIALFATRSTVLNDISSVTSTIGAFERVTSYATGLHNMEVWVCRSSTGAATSVTATLGDALTYFCAMIELPQPVQDFYAGDKQGGTAITGFTNTVTPLRTNDFILCFANCSVTPIAPPASGWTNYISTSASSYWKSGSANFFIDFIYQFTSVITALTAAWTFSSANATGMSCGFRFAFGGKTIVSQAVQRAGFR